MCLFTGSSLSIHHLPHRRAYGFWFHLINIGIYVVFLGFLTTYIVTYDPAVHADDRVIFNVTSGIYTSVTETHRGDVSRRPCHLKYINNLPPPQDMQ